MRAKIVKNRPFQSNLEGDKDISEFLDAMVSHLGTVGGFYKKGGNSTSVLKSDIGLFFDGWNVDLLIQQDFPTRKFPSSHLHVDFQNEFVLGQPPRKTQVTVEIFGDNRQAIASNLLKLELAGRNFSRFGRSLGIGLCLTKSLKATGWDGSTASDEEYEFAMLNTYSMFIETPLVLIALGQD